MGGYAAILLILTVLFAAPLVLGSLVAARTLRGRAVVLWFGVLTGLLVAALGLGGVGVVLALL
jgi:hypothetical protein